MIFNQITKPSDKIHSNLPDNLSFHSFGSVHCMRRTDAKKFFVVLNEPNPNVLISLR